ncbi:MAG: GH32 C-terminal domain-containing protein [Verrucomicrobiales bacterium]|nr:GH32 C-terminal domain-containing protein [Verrucomicrobiales bacterium]
MKQDHSVGRLLPIVLLLSVPVLAAEAPPLRDKTFVVWVAPANLTQRGGGVLTVQTPGGSTFDSMVFGELSPGKWMAGSDGFARTQRDQAAVAPESTDPRTLVQIAVVYQGNQVSIFRNGQALTSYQVPDAVSLPGNSEVLMGLRHTGASPKDRHFVGAIDDARVYATALTRDQIVALEPNQPSTPAPWAWWDFEEGRPTDRLGGFESATLTGGARVENGRLRLDNEGAYLLATREMPQSGAGNADATARALREKLLGDPFRPGYHFVTPEGVCMPFDPNGALYWKGRYHLFYIFQDRRGHNWGHVSSTDLFHWRHHPTGLVDGMFSGNAFLNREGQPTICYHQVGQGNAMAVAVDDDLNEWKKLESNPITPKTQPGDPNHDRYRSWDPYGWLEGDTYYAIFGGERPGLVKSPSLAGEWKYVGDFLANTVPGVSLTEDVSCADFFRLGDQHMLLCISHRLGARYYLGEWKDEQFHPKFHEMLSWVDHTYFAPESLLDDRGRRIMWAWMMDRPGFKTRSDAGWSGTMGLPRVLTLDRNGRLRMNPPEEIERLRYHPRQLHDVRIGADTEVPLSEIRGNSLELEIEMRASQAAQFGVKVCSSPGGEEQTSIFYDAHEKKLVIDTRAASLTEGPKVVESAPFSLDGRESLKLRVFVDKSVVEVFANDGRQAVARRLYPSRPDSLGVSLFAKGGDARVAKVRAWDMAASNPY